MDTSLTIALVVFVASVIAARLMGEAALKHLDVQQKGALIEAFSKQRVVGLIFLGVIFLVYLGFLHLVQGYTVHAFVGFFAVMAVYIAVVTRAAFKRLKTLAFPREYIRLYILSTVVRFAGLGVFVALMASDLV